MVYRSSWGQDKPDKDTGWGLIFRLNRLLDKVEYAVDSQNYEMWNRCLDRIFINMCYKNEEEIIYDSKTGKPIDVKIPKEDIEVFSHINEQIKKIKNNITTLKSKEEIFMNDKRDMLILQNNLYNLYVKKDIWMRKKMFQNKLYLKQEEKDPRKAVYGG